MEFLDFNLNILIHWIQIQLKRNAMQINVKDIEILFITIWGWRKKETLKRHKFEKTFPFQLGTIQRITHGTQNCPT